MESWNRSSNNIYLACSLTVRLYMIHSIVVSSLSKCKPIKEHSTHHVFFLIRRSQVRFWISLKRERESSRESFDVPTISSGQTDGTRTGYWSRLKHVPFFFASGKDTGTSTWSWQWIARTKPSIDHHHELSFASAVVRCWSFLASSVYFFHKFLVMCCWCGNEWCLRVSCGCSRL